MFIAPKTGLPSGAWANRSDGKYRRRSYRVITTGHASASAALTICCPSAGRSTPVPTSLDTAFCTFANPGCSVNDIVARIGLPQGYVSECIAKLREAEMVETTTDPSDRRRTLVNFGRRHAARVLAAGAAPVDDALASALGEEDREALADVLNVLSSLGRRLRPRAGRPVARGLTPTPGPKSAR